MVYRELITNFFLIYFSDRVGGEFKKKKSEIGLMFNLLILPKIFKIKK